MTTHPDVISVPIFRDPIGLYASSSHPLSKLAEPLTLKEVSLLKNICCNSESTFWPHLAAFFEKQQLRLDHAYDIDNLESLKSTIIISAAVGFLPQMATTAEVSQGLLCRLPIDPVFNHS